MRGREIVFRCAGMACGVEEIDGFGEGDSDGFFRRGEAEWCGRVDFLDGLCEGDVFGAGLEFVDDE